ncbi:MAG TPA: UDP-N-acetylglucosamine--N-acetylmuramyl-(pentapeptide) pyrophosphoryl-undecaprenol N-acetylglucosamine transferase [Clostridia bacterium]
MQKLKIVLCGGGTAGHIMPHVALIEELKKVFDEIHYIGSVGGMEKGIMSVIPDVIYHEITCVKFRRSLSPKNLAIPFKLTQGVIQAKKLLNTIKPAVIFSKGGYVSVPVVWAAPKDCKVFVHESDMSMGLANKLCQNRANKILCTFSTLAQKLKKGMHTGTPLRSSIYRGNKQKIFDELKIGRRKVILVMGGSLGAKRINEVLRETLGRLLVKYDIIHITGKGNIDTRYNYPDYHQFEFRTDIPDIYAASDLVVTRSGSNAICELAALKKPMLLIPLPKAESRGDQIQNAQYFFENGLAEVLYQEDLDAERLYESIMNLEKNKQKYITNLQKMPNLDGTRKVLDIITSSIKS